MMFSIADSVISTNRLVDISGVKNFARTLSRDSLLREVILAEPDQLSPVEFLAKSEVWLRICRKEQEKN